MFKNQIPKGVLYTHLKIYVFYISHGCTNKTHILHIRKPQGAWSSNGDPSPAAWKWRQGHGAQKGQGRQQKKLKKGRAAWWGSGSTQDISPAVTTRENSRPDRKSNKKSRKTTVIYKRQTLRKHRVV